MNNIYNISLINGPNLNLLGSREIDKYGNVSFKNFIDNIKKYSYDIGINLLHMQSNSESKIVNYIQNLKKNNVNFFLINAASFTHTSISIRDSILSINIPFIEIHITNIYSREPFRKFSYLSDIALGVICGLGLNGYKYALNFSLEYLKKKQ